MSWAAILALLAVAAAFAVGAWLLYRSVNSWPVLPAWTWRDIRQLIALVATVAGAAALTLFAWWLADRLYLLLAKDLDSPVAATLAAGLVWGLKLLLVGVLGVILSLGFVIGRRQFRAKRGDSEINWNNSEDDSEPPPPPHEWPVQP